jgi:hypothetical protein
MPSKTSSVPAFAKDLTTPGTEEQQRRSITHTVIRSKSRWLRQWRNVAGTAASVSILAVERLILSGGKRQEGCRTMPHARHRWIDDV